MGQDSAACWLTLFLVHIFLTSLHRQPGHRGVCLRLAARVWLPHIPILSRLLTDSPLSSGYC